MTQRKSSAKKKKGLDKGKIENISSAKKEGNPNSITGIIHVNPRGFGFVEVNDPRYSVDIFIPKQFTKNAIDGDTVEISVASFISEKGPEGKVLNIVTRNRKELVGVVFELSKEFAKVFVPMLGKEQEVLLETPNGIPLSKGDRVVMTVTEWGSKNQVTACTLKHKIGNISDPATDIPTAILEYGIRNEFPKEAVEEALSYGKTVSAKALEGREDLRELETFTIDPDTAKDFDDAISLSKDSKGIYHLGVHIADVGYYVKEGTALDEEAKLRSNSTYFPGTCIPMLPKELSDNLCSLKPKVNRLTVSVFMDFDGKGEMIHYRIARSVIKSQQRFTYKQAKAALEGKLNTPHLPTLKLTVELCQLLKRKRYERGSVEFALPELTILVDEKGVPTGTDLVEYDVTHQLIEEFMLKANETVAHHLDREGKGVPYRIHDEPSEDNMRDFSLMAMAFGFKIPPKPTPQDIQKLFEEASATPFASYLATSYIRKMRLAIYSAENIGHFGLALTHYCHFTSPIRRYVDLVAHRLIFAKKLDIQMLNQIADRCSERERISAKAEGSVMVLKKYRLLEKYRKENSDREYAAVVTRVKPFGITFEVLEIMLEGFLHVSEIGSDYYEFDERRNQLVGSRRGEHFAAGDRITVRLKELDLVRTESLWEIC